MPNCFLILQISDTLKAYGGECIKIEYNAPLAQSDSAGDIWVVSPHRSSKPVA